jgi:hypothetical protein
VHGTPERLTATCCSLLILRALAGPEFELVSELISTPAVILVAELGADVDGVEGCDWSEFELPSFIVANSSDGLSLMASS